MQETCVIHSFPNQDVVLEENSQIGHGAILHGCHIAKNVLIGMNAVVMDKAMVGRDSIVGALSFIKAGQVFDAGQMIAGAPAKVLRSLTEDEISWKQQGTCVYQTLARIAPRCCKRQLRLSAKKRIGAGLLRRNMTRYWWPAKRPSGRRM